MVPDIRVDISYANWASNGIDEIKILVSVGLNSLLQVRKLWPVPTQIPSVAMSGINDYAAEITKTWVVDLANQPLWD